MPSKLSLSSRSTARRAAIYARFSSDQQKDRSIADQIALCREVCTRESFAVIELFEDRALSGSSVINRPGYQALMRAAQAKRFDVIVAEDMDRIFRDQADYHNARKTLDFVGVSIHTASGQVTRIEGALRSLMGEMYIENLRLHVRRGLDGVIRDGRHAGGRAYGYRAIPGKPGELEIVPAEAEIVRGIFRDYASGTSARTIAHALNVDGIAAPRGRQWNASTINGNAKRSAGMMLNELYCGRIVWNKTSFVKDPTTGKRISQANPDSEWRRADAPHLRIVDDALFARAQLRRQGSAEPGRQQQRPQRHFHMLSGLMRCGTCGGSLRSVGQTRNRHGAHVGRFRVQCSTFLESGTCNNGRKVRRDRIERLVLDALRTEMANPTTVAEYVKTYNAERRRLAKDSSRERATLERRLGELTREIERLGQAIAKGRVQPETIADVINGAHAEREQVRRKMADLETAKTVIAIHPEAIAAYRRDFAALEAIVAGGTAAAQDQMASLRRLVDRIVVHAKPNDDDVWIEVHGRLQELIAAPVSGRGELGGSERGIWPASPRSNLLFRIDYAA